MSPDAVVRAGGAGRVLARPDSGSAFRGYAPARGSSRRADGACRRRAREGGEPGEERRDHSAGRLPGSELLRVCVRAGGSGNASRGRPIAGRRGELHRRLARWRDAAAARSASSSHSELAMR
ncbi:hypothetical protein HPB48_016911 [Haemaphysalis longicornis]|uniref:Uncharacterized protein n=1 Tax=Haemaphysalis longicornis TaxID=44386 RepID=A0A9J6G469_HAELO|nr:hypothetical protein HPB48_016911 [Haemaphysalis longicornis]